MLKHSIYATLIFLTAINNGYCSMFHGDNEPLQNQFMKADYDAFDKTDQEMKNHRQRSHDLIEHKATLNNRNFVDGLAGLMSLSAGTGMFLSNVVSLFKAPRLMKGRIFTNILLFTMGYHAVKSYNRENLALEALAKAAEVDLYHEFDQILRNRQMNR